MASPTLPGKVDRSVYALRNGAKPTLQGNALPRSSNFSGMRCFLSPGKSSRARAPHETSLTCISDRGDRDSRCILDVPPMTLHPKLSCRGGSASTPRPSLVNNLAEAGCSFNVISSVIRHKSATALENYFRTSAWQRKAALQAVAPSCFLPRNSSQPLAGRGPVFLGQPAAGWNRVVKQILRNCAGRGIAGAYPIRVGIERCSRIRAAEKAWPSLIPGHFWWGSERCEIVPRLARNPPTGRRVWDAKSSEVHQECIANRDHPGR